MQYLVIIPCLLLICFSCNNKPSKKCVNNLSDLNELGFEKINNWPGNLYYRDDEKYTIIFRLNDANEIEQSTYYVEDLNIFDRVIQDTIKFNVINDPLNVTIYHKESNNEYRVSKDSDSFSLIGNQGGNLCYPINLLEGYFEKEK